MDLDNVVVKEPTKKNGSDPVLEATSRIESRIENLENMMEELIEKFHDLEASIRIYS